MPRLTRIGMSIALIFGAGAGPAAAAPAQLCSGEICVSGAWVRATPPGSQTAAVYFSIVNNGRAADSLVSASSSVTEVAMIHRSVTTGNFVRMEMTGRVELAPGARVAFAPIGYHLMLDGLKQRLTEGMTIPVTLDFAKAGKLTFPVPVLALTSAGPKAS